MIFTCFWVPIGASFWDPQAMAAPGRAINPRQVLYANVDLSRFGLEVISLLDHQLSIEALLERGPWGLVG